MIKRVVLVFCLSQLAAPAWAEFGTQVTGTDEFNNLNLDPGANNAPTVETTSINATEGSVLQNTVFNQSLPVDNPNLGGLDVSDKFGQPGAAGSSQAGKIAAIATGASLMAAGVPMTASIIASVRAAGYALIAKAALEFAQAAADAGAEAGNRDIENNRLRFNDDNPEAMVSKLNNSVANAKRATAEEIASKLNSEGLNNLLTDRGVNSEDFINALANGEITSPEDIARAMGDNTSFSEEDLFKGEQLAASKLGEEMESLRIQVNEDNEETDTSSSGAGGLSVGALGNGSVLDQGTLPGVNGAGGSAGGGSLLTSALNPSGSVQGALGDLLGKFRKKDKDAASALGGLTIDQLHRLGLVKLRRGMNIFQKANRSYRSFGRWRDQELRKVPRVARHP